jgi:hypothetical protein
LVTYPLTRSCYHAGKVAAAVNIQILLVTRREDMVTYG